MTLPADRLTALLRSPTGLGRRIGVARHLATMPGHVDVLLLVLHLVDLLLHVLLLTGALDVLHDLFVHVPLGSRKLLRLCVALVHKALLSVLLLILVQVLA